MVRAWLTLAFVLLLASPAHAAIAFVQHKGAAFFGGNCVISPTSATTAGALLVVSITSDTNNNPASSVTDNGSNTYTHLTAADQAGTFGYLNEYYYAFNTASTTTITVNTTASGACGAMEFSGANTTSPVDATGVLAETGGSDPLNGATVTPTDAGSVCVSVVREGDTGADAVSSPWTGFLQTNVGGSRMVFAYLLAGGASAQTASFTGWTIGNYISNSAAFLPGGGAPATPRNLTLLGVGP